MVFLLNQLIHGPHKCLHISLVTHKHVSGRQLSWWPLCLPELCQKPCLMQKWESLPVLQDAVAQLVGEPGQLNFCFLSFAIASMCKYLSLEMGCLFTSVLHLLSQGLVFKLSLTKSLEKMVWINTDPWYYEIQRCTSWMSSGRAKMPGLSREDEGWLKGWSSLSETSKADMASRESVPSSECKQTNSFKCCITWTLNWTVTCGPHVAWNEAQLIRFSK